MNRQTRAQRLAQLYREGKPLRIIAEEHGGTWNGVRSTLRGMIARGELEQRQKPRPGARA